MWLWKRFIKLREKWFENSKLPFGIEPEPVELECHDTRLYDATEEPISFRYPL